MASLTNTTIASTYPLLLKVDSNGIDGTLRAVEDGDGTDTALKLSTGAIQVDNIKIDGNTISSTDTNGNIVLSPNGSGVVTADITGDLTGDVTGNVTGNCSGTAATVTGAAQTNITSLGTLTTLTVDDMTLNGSTISDAGAFDIDAGGVIKLDAGGGQIQFFDDGTEIGVFESTSSNFIMESKVQDKDILFKGNDGGSGITAMTLDMSEGGNATFAGDVNATGNITTDGIFKVDSCPDNNVITFNQSNREHSFYTYFSGTTGQNQLTVRVSDGTTDGSKNDVVNFMGDLVADFQGRIIANGAPYHARASHGNVFQCDTNGNAAITLLSASNTSNSVGSDIVSLNFAATNYYSSSKDGVYGQIRCENSNGTYADRGQLVFATGYDGDTVNDRMYIAATGNVGIGEDVPGKLLDLKKADDSQPLIQVNQNGNAGGIMLNMHDVTTARSIECMNSSETTQWYIRMSGDYSLGSSVSDKDLKKEIKDIPSGSLKLVNKLKPKTFKWKESENRGDTTKTGFIAQDIAAAFGLNESMATGTDGKKDMGIDTTGIVAHLTKAVQELSAKVTALENA